MKKTAVLLAALVVAFAARAQTPAPAKNVAQPLVSVGAKLPSELKLDPATLRAIHLGPPPTAADEVDVAVANVKTEAERVKTARRAYEAAEFACAARRYSAQDMQNAGCNDTGTVAACTDRLYRRCMYPPTLAYRNAASRFQRAVVIVDQKARALAFPPETP